MHFFFSFFVVVVASVQMSTLILIYCYVYSLVKMFSVVLISENRKHIHILLLPTLMYVEDWRLPVWVC